MIKQIKLALARSSFDLAGRVLLSGLFFLSSIDKIAGYSDTVKYMTVHGVPGELLPAVIVLEGVGAVALILGWKTRVTAFALAAFSLVAAVVFHRNFGDQMEVLFFLKDLSIAGGLLLLVANGAGPFSVDQSPRKVRAQGAGPHWNLP